MSFILFGYLKFYIFKGKVLVFCTCGSQVVWLSIYNTRALLQWLSTLERPCRLGCLL